MIPTENRVVGTTNLLSGIKISYTDIYGFYKVHDLFALQKLREAIFGEHILGELDFKLALAMAYRDVSPSALINAVNLQDKAWRKYKRLIRKYSRKVRSSYGRVDRDFSKHAVHPRRSGLRHLGRGGEEDSQRSELDHPYR